MDWPCHAAGKPVAMIPNCAATRHAHFTLDGSGPSFLERPSWTNGPRSLGARQGGQAVNLDTLTPRKCKLEAGRPLLLNGKMLTGRDAAHKRIQDMLAKGEPLPVDFRAA
jgi:fumarate hydratase class I